jgi:hypothetical protein
MSVSSFFDLSTSSKLINDRTSRRETQKLSRETRRHEISCSWILHLATLALYCTGSLQIPYEHIEETWLSESTADLNNLSVATYTKRLLSNNESALLC